MKGNSAEFTSLESVKQASNQPTNDYYRVGPLDVSPPRPEAEDDEGGEGEAIEQPGREAE